MHKKFIKLVSVLLMFAVVFSICSCDEFEDYDYDYDDDQDYDYDYDIDSDDPTKAPAETYAATSFDAEKNPYYAILTGKEKDCYSQLYAELSQGKQSFSKGSLINRSTSQNNRQYGNTILLRCSVALSGINSSSV